MTDLINRARAKGGGRQGGPVEELARSVFDTIVPGKKVAYGTSTVLGSQSGVLVDVVTGLTTINFAVATVKDDAPASTADGAYAILDHGADGKLDFKTWDAAGDAATNDTVVYWVAFGT